MHTATFTTPDLITSLPLTTFEFSRPGWDAAAAMLSGPPEEIFHRLLRDQESEESLLAARRVIDAFLSRAVAPAANQEAGADVVVARVASARADLGPVITSLTTAQPPLRQAVLRQRAPLGLIGGCWLDTISQPATQPSVVVNRLFAHHVRLRGGLTPRQSSYNMRRRALSDAGVHLPEVGATDFLRRARARPLTAVHATFYLALSRLPANFLPEVVGVHYAFHALGVDDLLVDAPPMLPEPDLRTILAEYLSLAGGPERRRLLTAVQLVLALEREHVAMLADLATWHREQSLDAQVAEIVARHAPYAGSQHGSVRVGGRLLSETFSDPHLDPVEFVREFRRARQVRPAGAAGSRFLRAIKFGGPMFGIFDEQEATILRTWVDAVARGDLPEGEFTPNQAGDAAAVAWRTAIAASAPADIVLADAHPADDRELFYRLVNIENFANTLVLAAQRAEDGFAASEILFNHGAAGRYTDATFFEYSPQALHERAERIYVDKLINPYRPLDVIPDRNTVIFQQKLMALGALIDGAWIHRIGNLGRLERESDEMLSCIYADEMGHGDLEKNHITLIHRALSSMGIELSHIRDVAFMDQGELPDSLYPYAIAQLCMGLFPDRFYNEILGYNLAIEMFGLGELRLHEIQKLRHHNLDDCYEQAHLTIDNLSAGHAKQAANIIVSYLDSVRRTVGDAAAQKEWRRVWRGYASFAFFVEYGLVRDLQARDLEAKDRHAQEVSAELVI